MSFQFLKYDASFQVTTSLAFPPYTPTAQKYTYSAASETIHI